MTVAQWEVLGVIFAVLSGVVGVILTVRDQARKQAQSESEEKEKIRTDAYAAGVQSQAYIITQLTAQRDDARHDRDVATAQSTEGWRRYNDLLENTRNNRRDS